MLFFKLLSIVSVLLFIKCFMMYHKHVKNHTILLCGIEEKEDAVNGASEGFLNVFF